jgi:hypothetical protein
MPRASHLRNASEAVQPRPVLQWLPLAPEKRYSLGCETY